MGSTKKGIIFKTLGEGFTVIIIHISLYIYIYHYIYMCVKLENILIDGFIKFTHRHKHTHFDKIWKRRTNQSLFTTSKFLWNKCVESLHFAFYLGNGDNGIYVKESCNVNFFLKNVKTSKN